MLRLVLKLQYDLFNIPPFKKPIALIDLRDQQTPGPNGCQNLLLGVQVAESNPAVIHIESVMNIVKLYNSHLKVRDTANTRTTSIAIAIRGKVMAKANITSLMSPNINM